MTHNLSISDHLKVLFLFLAFSVIFTYPLIINMNNMTDVDNYQFVFAFWWFKKAIFSFQNPFFTDYIFYPEGVNLALHASTFSNFILTLPVSVLFNATVAVNAAYLLSMAISGYAAFLLTFELTASKPASMVAGIIFAFNPFYQLRSLNIVALQWIPLYFLMFKRMTERHEHKWAIFTGVALSLIILTDQFQTISVVIITATSVPVLFFRRNFGSLKIITDLAIIIGVAIVASGGYLYQAIEFMVNNPEATKRGTMEHGGANMFSGDLGVYFIPPASHPLWGSWFNDYTPRENVSFLGYLPLLLAIAGGAMFFKKGIVTYLVFITLLFWVLSLGTYLHVNGEWKWDGNSYALPFLYLTGLPVIGDIRTPCRFHMITILGVSLLAAYGVLWILEKYRITGIWLSIAISAIILIEFLAPPPPMALIGTPVPSLYKKMSRDKDDYTVLELPLSKWSALHRNGRGDPAILMYYQTVHGKRILNGHVSRAPIESLDFKDPILNTFVQFNMEDNNRIQFEKRGPTDFEFSEVHRAVKILSTSREEFFKKYNIRYIVLHAPISWNNTLSRAFVEGFTGKSLVDVPDDNIAYIKVQ